jgi:hypothetical protein
MIDQAVTGVVGSLKIPIRVRIMARRAQLRPTLRGPSNFCHRVIKVDLLPVVLQPPLVIVDSPIVADVEGLSK